VATISHRTQLIGAVAAVAVGLVVGSMIYLHPEGLRVPAWVAYVAATAFVFTGVCLLAGAAEINWLQRWLGIAVTLSLLVISLWIAFGPGERECSMSIPFLQTAVADGLCRGAFGIGALLVALLLGLLVRRVIWNSSEG
jgi:cytosine/uracil/thiamine/allantoin permease